MSERLAPRRFQWKIRSVSRNSRGVGADSDGRPPMILGVRRDTLSALLNEETRLSPEMALRVEKAFDLDMDMMLRMQAWHDVATMRRRADEIVVERYDWGIGYGYTG